MKECAIVTGGVKGIGRRVSEMLAGMGILVFATYRSDVLAAEAVRSQSDNQILTHRVDGSDINSVQEFRSIVVQHGTPTILINNAGLALDGLLVDNGRQRIFELMNNNFMGTVNYSLTFIEDMLMRRQGNIVNISSSAAQKVKPGNSAYGCSKVAIERFSKGLAKEVGRFDVLVNCVAPGFVETEMFEAFAAGSKKDILREIPTRRILSTDHVAQLVVDIAMRRTNTTGSVFCVGNGEQII
ncbi:SDR family NAD(P)-dependent oxidoreductase [Mesorhizobium sp. NPDC059054]|uniref:SDR family NAD(P)-dependent oxidoreductase n=1 Tax=unclassified Mesorhizobium TaxID=325217 RepID=UPI0036767119